MTDTTLALQQAIVAAVRDDATLVGLVNRRIYDRSPAEVTPPYITLGPADVISADAYEAFTEAGGPYDKVVGKRLFEKVFSVGKTVEESTAYRSFRGKDPTIGALMKNRGFPYVGENLGKK